MSIRVYKPGSWMNLREVVSVQQQAGDVLAPDWNTDRHLVYTVTEALRSALPDLDDEGLEHYAMTEAAQASLRLFYDEGEPMRRIVMAVDVDSVEPVQDGLCEVHAEFSVPNDVVAWLVDTDGAAPAVSDVAGSLPLTGTESTEDVARIERAVAACLEHDLAYYAASETDLVMELS
ncbi:hypothetical protein EXE58_02480 [Nocardioides seonyuensis]|uniref:Uncharacterized protein n=1 Tax=Nocardioides seonyuensis TaxID=2518371 RepID=A0A4P7IBK0_9ACTN|nr:hypothetical protein [Nocardioides seonyuensis]QBX54444.1 hypothetical protein EXE58_02480 [Nocardioides seonyuensis]